MHWNRWIAAAVLGAGLMFGGQASAQDRQAQARELLQVMDVETTVIELFSAMAPMMAASVSQEMRLTPAEQARLGELLDEEFRNATPELMTQLATIYANSLSENELSQILGFLRSPAGAALIRSQENAETELERVGQVLGMRVALTAITRLNQERAARQ
ncbi:MAG: DUF2059 domain-containing protein [Hyphomonadaceae bacterium]